MNLLSNEVLTLHNIYSISLEKNLKSYNKQVSVDVQIKETQNENFGSKQTSSK